VRNQARSLVVLVTMGSRRALVVLAAVVLVTSCAGTSAPNRSSLLAPARPLPRHLLHCPRTARACVDTRHRVAWLQRHGHRVFGPVPVSLGRRGFRTPRGTFHVAWKAPHWTSTEFGLPMPWSVFFAAGGIAFHAGPLDRWTDARTAACT
jgi:hypothetical protein